MTGGSYTRSVAPAIRFQVAPESSLYSHSMSKLAAELQLDSFYTILSSQKSASSFAELNPMVTLACVTPGSMPVTVKVFAVVVREKV